MAKQSFFKRISDKAPGVVGEGLDIIGDIAQIFARKPNVKAWAKAKRAEKRRLRAMGIDKADQRQRLRVWLQSNPKPRGSDPYNPTALGESNQMNPQAQALGNGQLGFPSTPTPKKGGFNPAFLLLLAVPFFFLNRKGRKKVNILGFKF